MSTSVNSSTTGVAGYSNIGAFSPTVTSSPFVYTNTSYGLQQVSMSGGALSNMTITRSGAASGIGLTSNMVILGPTDSVTIIYTVAPVMLVIQLT